MATPLAAGLPPSPDVPRISGFGAATSGARPGSPRGRSASPSAGRMAASGGSLSARGRAASAERSKPATSPLTPRQKKATRSLFKELGMAVRTMRHSIERVKQAYAMTNGTIGELQAAADGAHRSLANNAHMHASTKDTGAKSPSKSSGPRKLNPTEMEELRVRLRDDLWAAGDERFPTEYEIAEEVKKVQEKERLEAQSATRRQSVANKPIVEALEKLRDSSARSAVELEPYRDALVKQQRLLEEVLHVLMDHKEMRDQLFDPVHSNPQIERSVLYQKANPMAPLKLPIDDKNLKSASGRLKSAFGTELTGHEATEVAAEREDGARNACTRALKAVRDARSELNLRKSALQVSVRTSRDMVLRQRRAAKSGKFGSSEERNTDPATRKTATNPEDAG